MDKAKQTLRGFLDSIKAYGGIREHMTALHQTSPEYEKQVETLYVRAIETVLNSSCKCAKTDSSIEDLKALTAATEAVMKLLDT